MAAIIVVWTIWAVVPVFAVVGVLTARQGGPDDPLAAVVIGIAGLSFATSGAILVSRLPRHPIGWLLVSGGLCIVLGSAASGLADQGLTAHPGSVPGAIWFAWLSEWIWALSIGSIVGLTLVYPSGQLLSPRWRLVATAGIVVIAILSIGSATGPWPAGQFPVENPLLVAGAQSGPMGVVNFIVGLIALLVALLGVTSLVIRYRRALGVERAQLKWFAAVAALSVPAFLVTAALYGMTGDALIVANVAGLVAFTGFALLPIAIGIAILRYRLYEIDRLISRTIAYGVVTAILVTLFVAVVLAVQAVLGPVTGSSTIAVAGSTLLVAALFAPVRRRVQRLVDRRFNRSRYDAERTVAAFAGRLRDEVDLGQLRFEIRATVSAAVEPSSVSLWLRE